jgi:hypothetical protein
MHVGSTCLLFKGFEVAGLVLFQMLAFQPPAASAAQLASRARSLSQNFQNTHLLVLRLSRCVSLLEVETDIVSTDATGSVSWLCRANLGEDDHDLLVGYVDYLYPRV